MGVNGYILIDINKLDMEKLLCNTLKAACYSKLYIKPAYYPYFQNNHIVNYCTFELSSYPFYFSEHKGFNCHIINTNQFTNTLEVDWISKKILYKSVVFESLYNNELDILNLSYQYLKLIPNSYFWSEKDWIYDFDDLTAIKTNTFNSNWCYQPLSNSK